MALIFQLPEAEKTLVSCNSCGVTTVAKSKKEYKKARRHLDHCKPKKENKAFECNQCGKTFKNEKRMLGHPCIKRSLQTAQFTDYTWSGLQSEFEELCREELISKMASVCMEQRKVVPNFYPGLFIPLMERQDRERDEAIWTRYGNPKAISFFEKVTHTHMYLVGTSKV